MSNKHYNWRECIPAFSSIFSFVGFKIIDLEESKETLIVTLDATELPRCPKCGELCNRYDDVYIRSVNDFHLSIFSCRIQFPARQIRCKCGYRGNQYIDFVHPYSHCTKRFEDYIAMFSTLKSDRTLLTDSPQNTTQNCPRCSYFQVNLPNFGLIG